MIWKIFDKKGQKKLQSKVDEDGKLRGKGKKAKLYHNYFLIFVDFRKNLFDICEVGVCDMRRLTATSFKQELSDIQDAMRKRRSTARIRIYVSQIEVLLNILTDYDIILTQDYTEKHRPLMARTDCFEICDYAILHDTAPKSIDDMIRFFSVNFSDTLVSRIGFSQASNSTKSFYNHRDLCEKCHEDRNVQRRYISTVDMWKDLRSGITKGLQYADPLYFGKTLHDIYSYDKKSAYPSIFVSYDKFPIGSIMYTDTSKKRRLIRCLDGDRWFKVVFRDVQPDVLSDMRIKARDSRLAISNLDLEYLKRCDREKEFFDAIDSFDWGIYYTDAEGYLLDEFREHVVDIYDKKEAASDSEYRRFYKKQIDILYGKGLERLTFDTDKMVRDYFKDGKHYIMPHWSQLVVSKLRLDLFDAIDYVSDVVLAFNTDGLKTTADCKEIFNKLNEDIRKKNICSGFDSDIGSWKFEYKADDFLQIDDIRYAYRVDGELHTAIGGIPKVWLMDFLLSLTCDPLDWLKFPHLLEVPVGWIQDKKTGTYVQRYYKDFMYRPLTFDIEQGFNIEKRRAF